VTELVYSHLNQRADCHPASPEAPPTLTSEKLHSFPALGKYHRFYDQTGRRAICEVGHENEHEGLSVLQLFRPEFFIKDFINHNTRG
jgi:hypothetical protein